MKALLKIGIGAVAALALAACAADTYSTGGDSAETVSVTSPATPTPSETTMPQISDQPKVQAAIADLASRWDVPDQEVQIAEYSAVTWSDGSAGCPQPGQVYTQALVPGERLVLQVDDRLASYHSANGGDFGYCAAPTAPSSSELVDPDI